MNSDEALAVYLYLVNAKRDSREEKAFAYAWDIICGMAEDSIERRASAYLTWDEGNTDEAMVEGTK